MRSGSGILKSTGVIVGLLALQQGVGWYLRRSVQESLRKELTESLSKQDSSSSGPSKSPVFTPSLSAPPPPPPALDSAKEVAEQAGGLLVCRGAYYVLTNMQEESIQTKAMQRSEFFQQVAGLHLLAATGEEMSNGQMAELAEAAFSELRNKPIARPGIYALCEAWTSKLAGVAQSSGAEVEEAVKTKDFTRLKQLLKQRFGFPSDEEINVAKQELDKMNFSGVIESAYSLWASRGYITPHSLASSVKSQILQDAKEQ